MTTLFLATANAHKAEEIRAILGPSFRYRSLVEFSTAPKTVEDAGTFAGNATKKAVEFAEWLGSHRHGSPGSDDCYVLADDSGLEVDALNGAPGVYSARFAYLESYKSGNAPDEENRLKLLTVLKEVSAARRGARFRCAVALCPVAPPKPEMSSSVCLASEAEFGAQLFEGSCEGRISFEPKGSEGFGYDSLFVPNGDLRSFAEIPSGDKNRISHRAKALEKVKIFFENRKSRDQ